MEMRSNEDPIVFQRSYSENKSMGNGMKLGVNQYSKFYKACMLLPKAGRELYEDVYEMNLLKMKVNLI